VKTPVKRNPRYLIRNERGEELVCPSLADLHALYAQGFLSDDDLVRAETSQRWVPVSSMPALRSARTQAADPRKLLLVFTAALVLALAAAILVRGSL
jgi:hypothetical protein